MKSYVLNVLLFLSVTLLSTSPDDAFMGISHAESSKPKGILIKSVVRNAPAQLVGLIDNDVIISIDNEKIENKVELTDFLGEKRPGDRIKIDYIRNNIENTTYLVLGRRSDYSGPMREGGRQYFPEHADSIMVAWKDDTLTSFIFDVIDSADYTDNYGKLAAAFKEEILNYKGFYTLDAVSLPLLQPLAVYASGEWIKKSLHIASGTPDSIFAGVPLVLDIYDDDSDLD